MYSIYFLIFAFVLAIGHIFIFNTPIAQTFLLYLLVIGGVQGIFAFIGHYFGPDETAEFIGWPKGNPFQKEIAFTNLGIGIAGVLCIWFRGNFWLAVVVMRSIFLLGAGSVHVQDRVKNKNRNMGNAGPILYMDFITPILLWILMLIY